jgi:methylglyoxal reductase
MKYKNIGMSDIKSSVVGLGTWAIGGWMWGGSDEKDAIRAIHAGIDEGINLIDTAPAYGFGKSDKVVLATKCGLIWHEQKGDFFFTSTEENLDEHGGINVYKCLSPEVIRYEVEQSLRRLKTDYIDIYQTHWQDFTTPIDETMQTLMELKKEGKIKAIGCSNATIEQMESYRRSGTLDADQELYSMLDRNHEQDNLPYVKEHGISFLAYSPLGQGLLTGKIGPDRVFEEGDQRRDNDRFSLSNRRKILTMLDSFRPIADAHGISLGQLVIAWIIAQPGCSHALVGARNPEQAVENAKAGSVILSVENLKNMQSVIDKFYD